LKTNWDYKPATLLEINKKNIIIIGPAHPLRGGLASYNERLAKAFQDKGNSVQIFTFSLQYPGFLFPGTTQFSSEPAPKNLQIHVCINSINPLNWIKIGKRIAKQKPDLIIVRYWLPFMGPCLGTILRIVKQNKHTKIVCIADNIIPHEKRIGDAQFTKYFVKPIDGFITMSTKVLEDLKQFTTTKPAKYVAHPLYDNFGEKVNQVEARRHLSIPLDVRLVLFFGFIRQYKGLDLLLDAIAILKKNNPSTNIKFLIAGEFYEDRKPYNEQINRLGIHEDLILRTDFIPDSEVKYYLCAADMLIQPYRNATQSGVTPLAYHFEIPMVVTNVGGLPALVPDNKVGLIAEPNAESIAEKIADYFELGAEKFLPGIQSEKVKYSWDVMTQEIFTIANLK
jgi:glycosyltransferase involved in cell wall biosynthesis